MTDKTPFIIAGRRNVTISVHSAGIDFMRLDDESEAPELHFQANLDGMANATLDVYLTPTELMQLLARYVYERAVGTGIKTLAVESAHVATATATHCDPHE